MENRIQVKHLFEPLDDKLMELLESLSPADWDKQTVAKAWKVKDVISHLLEGNLRTLSMQKEGYYGELPPAINSYQDLVNWLNLLNAEWIKASKRISPNMLIVLHKATNQLTNQYYQSLNPDAPAVFAVDWAGESESLNWMHLAREYTEKWHHQQQIREATGRDGIMTREFFYPFIDTFFRALPHTFKNTGAAVNTLIKITVTSGIGGNWYLQKVKDGWQLFKETDAANFAATVKIPPDIAWKLFSKSIRPDDVKSRIEVTGNATLAGQVLNMVSVIA
jgi:uncharacterized protein (TIGR03083 family)